MYGETTPEEKARIRKEDRDQREEYFWNSFYEASVVTLLHSQKDLSIEDVSRKAKILAKQAVLDRRQFLKDQEECHE